MKLPRSVVIGTALFASTGAEAQGQMKETKGSAVTHVQKTVGDEVASVTQDAAKSDTKFQQKYEARVDFIENQSELSNKQKEALEEMNRIFSISRIKSQARLSMEPDKMVIIPDDLPEAVAVEWKKVLDAFQVASEERNEQNYNRAESLLEEFLNGLDDTIVHEVARTVVRSTKIYSAGGTTGGTMSLQGKQEQSAKEAFSEPWNPKKVDFLYESPAFRAANRLISNLPQEMQKEAEEKFYAELEAQFKTIESLTPEGRKALAKDLEQKLTKLISETDDAVVGETLRELQMVLQDTQSLQKKQAASIRTKNFVLGTLAAGVALLAVMTLSNIAHSPKKNSSEQSSETV